MNVPHIIHQIWIGSSSVAQPYYNISLSWKKYHPTWEYVLWNDTSIKDLGLSQETKDILSNPNCNVVIKCDLLRYEILNRLGGLYADMDMECLKPLDSLFKTDFVCGIESNENIIGSALVGCLAGHPALQEVIRHIQTSFKKKCPTRVLEHLEVSGPFIFDGILKKYNIKPMPQEYFYPIGWNEYDKYDQLKNQFPNSYTKHWWRSCVAGGWTKFYKNRGYR